MMISDIAAILTGEGMWTKYTGGIEPPSRDEIARLAYHFYEARGRRDDQDIVLLEFQRDWTRHATYESRSQTAAVMEWA